MYLRRLRGMHEDSDLTQKQVSEVPGLQQAKCSRYERGAHDSIGVSFKAFLSSTCSNGLQSAP